MTGLGYDGGPVSPRAITALAVAVALAACRSRPAPRPPARPRDVTVTAAEAPPNAPPAAPPQPLVSSSARDAARTGADAAVTVALPRPSTGDLLRLRVTRREGGCSVTAIDLRDGRLMWGRAEGAAPCAWEALERAAFRCQAPVPDAVAARLRAVVAGPPTSNEGEDARRDACVVVDVATREGAYAAALCGVAAAARSFGPAGTDAPGVPRHPEDPRPSRTREEAATRALALLAPPACE